MAGTIASDALVPTSARAALCALALGLTGATTTLSVVNPSPASAGDCEGGGDPNVDAGDEPGDQGALGADCETGSAPEETVPLDPVPATGATQPEAGEPIASPANPAPSAAPAPTAAPAPSATPPPVSPVPPASSAPPAAPVPGPPSAATPTSPSVDPADGDATNRRKAEEPNKTADRPPANHRTTSAPAAKEAPARQGAAQQAPATDKPAAPLQSDPAEPAPVRQTNSVAERASYAVQPGDSLWSIARARLGSDATPAQLARYVQRLWEMNSDNIASGTPSVIAVGQQLTLPE